MQVLLVEDDPAIAESLVDRLEAQRYDVTWVTTGSEAIEASAAADLILLDLGLPDMDGLDVCREVRESSGAPIIMLTARDTESDRVLGLELGADDYLGKPFGFRELQARIRAVLRRANSADAGAEDRERVEAGPVSIDLRTREVTVNGEEIDLTPREYDLLVHLCGDPGTVHPRLRILEEVWDANWFGPTKTLDVHVAALRRKLGDPELIETVRGVGFRFRA